MPESWPPSRLSPNAGSAARTICARSERPFGSDADLRVVGPVELDRLIAELPVEYRTMVYLGATLGLRIGEAAGLRIRSVDFEHETVTVTESVGEAAGRLFTKGPKTGAARRTIPLPPPIVAMLLTQR